MTGANSVGAIFDVRTSTEKNYDYIYIYDKNNVQIGIYSHTNLSNQEIVVPGDTIKVRLTTDGATIDWGFKCRVYKKN